MVKKIAVISLSRGILGEPFVDFEVKIGLKRLKELGIEVVFTKNALKGMDYISKNPQYRAQDLLDAVNDSSIDMILCAIGGDDTYRLLPYLFENDELKKAVAQNAASGKKKIFLGYSDTTFNHFMLHKAGLNTFYGQAFLPDVCELENDMLQYSRKYFTELITTGTIKEIKPSPVWYESRKEYSEAQVGVNLVQYKNNGFELLQGKPVFNGKILGGCIESLYGFFDNSRYADTSELCSKYKLFPAKDEWKEKILLLESSEEMTPPDLYRKMVQALKATGVFEAVNGVLVGKPIDEVYYEEYKAVLIEEIANPALPLVYNVNIGHASPHCIIPFGIKATVDAEKQVITF